jgi:hypothetical protein
MRKSQVEQTTKRNLEAKFDRGEDVLDYFDMKRSRVIEPNRGRSQYKKPEADRETAVVREEPRRSGRASPRTR